MKIIAFILTLLISALITGAIYYYSDFNTESKQEFCARISTVAGLITKAKNDGIPLYMLIKNTNAQPSMQSVMTTIYSMDETDPYIVEDMFSKSCLKYNRE